MPLEAVAVSDWRALSRDVVEPNAYYLPDWELAVNASARGRTGTSVLCARSEASAPALIGLLPVTSLWRAYKLPLPALVSGQPYGTLCTPLLDRTMADCAAKRLLEAARAAGAHALL
ncbi:MAG: GNAT family N-acetyltransferase, partial [Bradyrhizobium sp.]